MTAPFNMEGGKDVDDQSVLLCARMAEATMEGTGKYIRYDGKTDPW